MTTAEPPTEVQGRKAVRLETAPQGNLPATRRAQAIQGDGSGNGRVRPTTTGGHGKPPEHLAGELASSYLRYLPGIYQADPFVGRFLLIFESILDPIDRQVANLHHYFDPELTPADVLPWLGGWLGLVMDERWPEERRRELISKAAQLYSWRGTPRGLRAMLTLYTGVEPEIDEPEVTEVDRDHNLAYTFTVRLTIPKDAEFDEDMVRRIIEQEKPAFARPVLEIDEE
jgi:phage tail-like protein